VLNITFFDLDPKICLKRIKTNRASVDLFENVKKLRIVRENYKNLPYFEGLIFINASRNIEEMQKKIENLIIKKLAAIENNDEYH